jgi:EAL domain-containing protein (putative c-di-GMP-specific phosphodiesterase class I)/ActR/RegA family two-component response regulator
MPLNKSDLVLVVDDDLFANKIICTQLRKLGFINTMGLTNPVEALEFLKLNVDEVKAVVCDLQMPTLDGIEFIREMAQEGFTGKVLLVSGEDPRVLKSAQRLVQAMGLQLLGAIQKPVQLLVLEQLLSKKTLSAVAPSRTPQFTIDEIRAAFVGEQFVNYYQPKVLMQTGEIVGAEALIRWQHPVHGLLSPYSFLKDIETHDLHDELLNYVLISKTGALPLLHQASKSAVQDANNLGSSFKIAVNLSDGNLRDNRLPEKLVALIAQYDVSIKNLVLEVSENRVAGNRSTLLGTLSRLALKGFSLSLDDFGAGETTMSDLSDIAMTELKFDRSFVHNVSNDSALRMTLSSCIRMAEALGMTTVAEGVELSQDWHEIKSLGCQIVQGYLVAKPMPKDQMLGWITHWNAALAQSELFVRAEVS